MGSLRLIFGLFIKALKIRKIPPSGFRIFFFSAALFCLFPGAGFAQESDLFASEEIFRITLSGEIATLLKDRKEEPEYTPVILAYSDSNGEKIEIPLKVRQRGNFRRINANCSFPPLLLNFAKESTANTIFKDQNKIKLVMPCRDENLVLQEYYTYKLYNLVSPKSFKVRLVEVVLKDPALKTKEKAPFYGFLLEEEDQMAKRNKMVAVDHMLLRPEVMQREDFLNMTVFNYLIGNTDWSVQYRQNIKLIAKDTVSQPVTVPYDFDHAGIVRASYAHPAEELKLNSTLQRRYRGFCMEDMKAFDAVIGKYNSIKKEIYNVYTSSTLLEEKYVRKTIKYLDEFYETLQDPDKLKKEFQYPCQKNSTGNIVIMGLKNH